MISLQGAGGGCTLTATKFAYLKQKKFFNQDSYTIPNMFQDSACYRTCKRLVLQSCLQIHSLHTSNSRDTSTPCTLLGMLYFECNLRVVSVHYVLSNVVLSFGTEVLFF